MSAIGGKADQLCSFDLLSTRAPCRSSIHAVGQSATEVSNGAGDDEVAGEREQLLARSLDAHDLERQLARFSH